MPKQQAQIKGTAVLATFPDGTKELRGAIAIDCETCGQGEVMIPGHHMKAVRDILIAWCDEFPEIVNQVQLSEPTKERYSGVSTHHPENN